MTRDRTTFPDVVADGIARRRPPGVARRWGRLAVLAVSANAALSLVAPQPAHAAWLGERGVIAFAGHSASSSKSSIWFVNADGSGLSERTPNDGRNDVDPAFSPEGGPHVANVGGPVDVPIEGSQPAWSPDSTTIAYVAPDPQNPSVQGIWLAAYDRRTPPVFLTDGRQPNWSPLGDKLVYVRDGNLWVANPNTRSPDPQAITKEPPAIQDSQPAWTPDSTHRPSWKESPGSVIFVREDGVWRVRASPAPEVGIKESTRISSPAYTTSGADWQPRCSNKKPKRGAVIKGTAEPDLLCGGRGNDRITGFGGADRIFAGQGHDVVHAGPGNDFVLGGVGTDGDVIYGGGGNDHIEGTQGPDKIYDYGRGSGSDMISAGDASDWMVAWDGIRGNDRIDGGDVQSVRDGRGRDPQVVRIDRSSGLGQGGRRPCVRSGDGDVHRQRGDYAHQGLDIRRPCLGPRADRTFDTVEQLSHRHRGDRVLLVRIDEILEPEPSSLDGPEDGGVDQDGHGSRGAVVTSRSFPTSSPNRSSGWGRRSTSSRSADPRTMARRGGLTTATTCPWRSISTVSPAATRVRSAEKPRLASVARTLIDPHVIRFI